MPITFSLRGDLFKLRLLVNAPVLHSKKISIAAVVGTTATGKSDLVYEAFSAVNASVINCDSIQMYREVEIGTAKPDAVILNSISHLFMDCVSPPKKQITIMLDVPLRV